MSLSRRHVNQPSSAFTLIELILVMAIMATVLALAAPSLTQWKKGSKLRNSAETFIAATRWARSRAAAEGSIYVISIDRGSSTYKVQVQEGLNTTDADGQFHLPQSLLEGGKIEASGAEKSQIDAINFYPTGRVDPASVKITADDGESITVQCLTPAEDFAIAGAEQSR